MMAHELGKFQAKYEAPPSSSLREEVQNVKIWFLSHKMTNTGGSINTLEAQEGHMGHTVYVWSTDIPGTSLTLNPNPNLTLYPSPFVVMHNNPIVMHHLPHVSTPTCNFMNHLRCNLV